MTETAVYALAITISVSLLGGSATVLKAWRVPHSEILSTWVLSMFGALFAVAAVGKLDLVLLAYPMYLLTLNAGIAGATLLGRARAPRAGSDAAPPRFFVTTKAFPNH